MCPEVEPASRRAPPTECRPCKPAYAGIFGPASKARAKLRALVPATDDDTPHAVCPVPRNPSCRVPAGCHGLTCCAGCLAVDHGQVLLPCNISRSSLPRFFAHRLNRQHQREASFLRPPIRFGYLLERDLQIVLPDYSDAMLMNCCQERERFILGLAE